MKKKISNVIPIWQFDHLSKEPSILHYTSGREGGLSSGTFESLNLSLSVRDDPENVLENRKRLAAELHISPDKFIFPGQTHSNHIRVIQSPEEVKNEISDTDGLVTNQQDICISVLTADCVPILFYDPIKQVIGVAHAGWRGTVSMLARKMIETFKSEFNSQPSDILVGIGPSIGPDTYEVGEEVIIGIKSSFGNESNLILDEKNNKKACLNLWNANRILLEHMRVPPENIEKAFLCTYTDDEFFFSARKLGKDCGRFGTGIMLKS